MGAASPILPITAMKISKRRNYGSRKKVPAFIFYGISYSKRKKGDYIRVC
jgi:hypothetical protein